MTIQTRDIKSRASTFYSSSKRLDATLRECEAGSRTMAEAAFEGIVESEGGRIVDCNEQLARMLGYTVAELKGVDIAGSFIANPPLYLISPTVTIRLSMKRAAPIPLRAWRRM
jgi:PAS domain-containing protein